MSFAFDAGYQNVRLDVVDREKQQTAAIQLYQSLGFYCIEQYNDNQAAQVFMEKQLP